jgi:cystathionine beta-lyase/cystathionine gamma-synthase
MENAQMLIFIKAILANMPDGWLKLTTHRLDIFDEKLAKTQFLEQFEILFNNKNSESLAISELPTAYDYIRLGHPLSCLLEWVIAKLNNIKPKNVISFSSKTIPILAILRKNLLANKKTQIVFTDELPKFIDFEVLKNIYGYKFDLKKVEKAENFVILRWKENIYLLDLCWTTPVFRHKKRP